MSVGPPLLLLLLLGWRRLILNWSYGRKRVKKQRVGVTGRYTTKVSRVVVVVVFVVVAVVAVADTATVVVGAALLGCSCC